MAWNATRSGRPEESLVARLHSHSLAATLPDAMLHRKNTREARHGQKGDGLLRRARGRRRAMGGVENWPRLALLARGLDAMNESNPSINQCNAMRSAKTCATTMRHICLFPCCPPAVAARHPSRLLIAIDVYAPSSWSLPPDECPASSSWQLQVARIAVAVARRAWLPAW